MNCTLDFLARAVIVAGLCVVILVTLPFVILFLPFMFIDWAVNRIGDRCL